MEDDAINTPIVRIYLEQHFSLKRKFVVSPYKIIIHESEFLQFLNSVYTGHTHEGKFYLFDRLLQSYNTEEELIWKIML